MLKGCFLACLLGKYDRLSGLCRLPLTTNKLAKSRELEAIMNKGLEDKHNADDD
jgi:hypothetical protein